MDLIAIIPARYASTRFPGKPLVSINGKPMIQNVYEQACKVFDSVFVATDDERIENCVKNFNGKVVMTKKKHKSGTDRCAEAIQKIEISENKTFDIIFNIQGDEPFINPEQLLQLKKCFKQKSTQIATLVKHINNQEDIINPNKPKVIINKKDEAIYFSRSIIPYIRGVNKTKWITSNKFYKHVGLYAYRKDILLEITKLPQSNLEVAESLEQLRWIENGYKIKIAYTEHESLSIDTPSDLEQVKQIILL
ncbi:MAG: 3-deoxy-manno-octulosonate cytidylyltransferase [Bacteroidales bacterium]|jgi:3-deoxy-manno-octulosonate cytidylyltransferase (CMP-KDO synthetase)|nr:3-deoxy-manno-octulosonate cytidylyltransferase [Bacteroidales bacterium]